MRTDCGLVTMPMGVQKKGGGEDMGVYMWVNDEGVQAEAGAGSGNE